MRKIDPAHLFWTIVLGFGTSGERSFARLRQRYEKSVGHTVEESSFQDRFNKGLARMFKAFTTLALDESFGRGQALRGALAGFRDVLIADATVIRLHHLLERSFAACRTNHTKAAAKLHVVMNLSGAGKQSVRITGERSHENRVLRVGRWVKDRLMLFDLGYYDFGLFARIHQHGGYFLSRLKDNANPTITAVHQVVRGRAVVVVGRSLQEVLPRLKREVLDVEVEVAYRKRAYLGKRTKGTLRLRLVGIRNAQSGRFHLYLTNVPPEKLPAEDVQTVYALRWQVELLFKELKSAYRLDEMPSRRKEVVETLLYAAILSLTLSRRLFAAIRNALPQHAERLKEQRFANLLATLSGDLLALVIWPSRHARYLNQMLSQTLLHEAVDPNLRRASLLQAVEGRALPFSSCS
jgi:IS4 transposase